MQKQRLKNFKDGSGVEAIRRYDADGRLFAAGAEWVEFRVWIKSILKFFGVSLVVVTGIAGMGALSTGEPIAIWVALAGIVLGFLLIIYGMRVMMQPRSIIFHVDGTTSSPDGKVIALGKRQVPDHWGGISTFEVTGEHETEMAVDLYARAGDEYRVGHEMQKDVANKLAVQLTAALAEIRDAVADGTTTISPQDALAAAREAMAGQRGGYADIVID